MSANLACPKRFGLRFFLVGALTSLGSAGMATPTAYRADFTGITAKTPCVAATGEKTRLELALASPTATGAEAVLGWLRLADRQTFGLRGAGDGGYQISVAEVEGEVPIGRAEIRDGHVRIEFAFARGPCAAGRFEFALGQPLATQAAKKLADRLAALFSLESELAQAWEARPWQYPHLAAIFERTEPTLAQHLPPRHPQWLLAKGHHAYVHALNKNAAALPMLAEVDEAQGTILPADDHDRWLLKLLRLLTLEEIGRNLEAVALGEALVIECPQALGPRHLLCARSLAVLAQSYLQIRNYPRAAEVAQRAVQELGDLLGVEHQAAISAKASYAAAKYSQYRADLATQTLEPLLLLARSRLGESHYLSLRIADLLARCYYQMGRWREGIALTEKVRSAALRETPPGEPMRRYATELLAWWYKELGRNAEAEALLREALAIGTAQLGEAHVLVAETRAQLALLLLYLSRPAAAFHQADLAYRHVRTQSGEANHSALWIRGIRAKALNDLGRTEETLAEARSVAEGFRILYGEGSAHATEAKTLLGRSLSLLGRHEEAIKVLAAAAEDQRRIRAAAHPDHVEILAELGEVQRRAHDLRSAATTWLDLVKEIEELREGIGPVEEYRQGLLTQWSPYFRKLAATEVELGTPARGFRVAEQLKARTLLESLSARFADGAGLVSAMEGERLRELAAELARRDQVLASIDLRAPERAEALHAKAQAARDLREYRDALGHRYPKYRQLMRIELKSVEDAAQIIPEDSAFLSYVALDEGLLLFVYTRETGLLAKKVAIAGGLLELVRAYRNLTAPAGQGVRELVWRLADGRYRVGYVRPEPNAKLVRSAEPVARRLAELLLTPLAPALAAKKRWIVSPDESLALVPLEALPWRGAPVVARHELSYIQSLSVLALLREARPRAQSAQSFMAMGDPDYRRPADGVAIEAVALSATDVRQQRRLQEKRWPPLPGTTLEVLRAAEGFDRDDRLIFFGAAASEAKLQELNRNRTLARHRYLHFATHAWLNTDAPQLSSVVLAQNDPSAAADGYVTAAEWIGYDLDSELIVLSGCETALGATVRGEGVTGLPFALLVAGNRKTLLSLWKIDDQAAAALIPVVFRHLQAGHSPAAAVTLAKRKLLRDPLYHAPRYWAPFVLYGG